MTGRGNGYLVTGGAGFIGSHIVEALLRRGDSVVVLDDFSTGRRDNLEAALRARPAGASDPEIIEGDIRDAAIVRRAVRGVTHVRRQAALPSVQRSVEDPVSSHAVNATGTLNLLVAARDAGVRRFVYASRLPRRRVEKPPGTPRLSPRRRSASTMCDPMNPAPPVTR